MHEMRYDETLAPDTWKPSENEFHKAWLKCPNGHIGGLNTHAIAEDGSVHPSVVCPEPSCNFHEYVRLIGWKPEFAQEFTGEPLD